jgi:hypothetical protein
MKRPWFDAEPVGEEFFDTAPMRLEETFEIARPAAEVWAELTEDNPLSWCRILQRIEWTSPRPFGVGTTRTARALRGALVINEEFFRWEEGRRKSFYVLEGSMPMFESLAEDYLVESTSDTSCAFTWTIAVKPKAAARPLTPGNKALLGSLFRDTRRHYDGA